MIRVIQAETKKQYVERLVNTLGVKQLGDGTFSRVFQHPVYPKVAVKLVAGDPMYLMYVQLCLKYQSNPWLPKIIGTHEVDFDAEDNATLVFMERLRKATKSEVKEAVGILVTSLAGLSADEKKIATRFIDREGEGEESSMWRILARRSTDSHIRQLGSVLSRIRADDVIQRNLMMRGKQLVVVDPVFSEL